MSTTAEAGTDLFGFSTDDDRADTTRHRSKFTEDALERHKRQGLELAVRARVVAMVVIGLTVSILTPWPEAAYYLIISVLFILIGVAQHRYGRVGTSRVELVLLFCDLLLMTIVAALPNPFAAAEFPAVFHYQFEVHKYFFVLLAMATLAYSWRTIFAVGTWTTGLWLIAMVGVWYFGDEHAQLSADVQQVYADSPILAQFMDPTKMQWDIRIQEIIVFGLCAVILAISVRRSNNLVLAQAAVERERTNLARYFSPNVVDQLSQNDDPLKQVTEQEIAVLFVDIVGFTSYAADRSPQDVIRTLREFHGMMEREVFRHSGTLDKYLGDGLMATFGTPIAGETDALNALSCARDMVVVVDKWNSARAAAGEPVMRASFGLHAGPVVLGDIGANRLEFAVIGNTVNVASRLEAMSRELKAKIVVSDSLKDRATAQSDPGDSVLDGMTSHENVTIRGVEGTIRVWTIA